MLIRLLDRGKFMIMLNNLFQIDAMKYDDASKLG